MFGRSKKTKKSIKALMLTAAVRRGLGAAIIFGGLAGAAYKVLSKALKSKSTCTGSGSYGAVAIARAFKGANFPMNKQEIMNKYGDKEIEYRLGKCEKVRDVLSGLPDETFNGTFEIEHAFHEYFQKNK